MRKNNDSRMEKEKGYILVTAYILISVLSVFTSIWGGKLQKEDGRLNVLFPSEMGGSKREMGNVQGAL